MVSLTFSSDISLFTIALDILYTGCGDTYVKDGP